MLPSFPPPETVVRTGGSAWNLVPAGNRIQSFFLPANGSFQEWTHCLILAFVQFQPPIHRSLYVLYKRIFVTHIGNNLL